MKVVILAGGFGTRISEETTSIPKPMVVVGGKPILWHIMKIYSKYGFNDFIILLGYKGYVIKEYFANYFLHQCDVKIDLEKNNIEILENKSEPWKITLLDTGINTLTGGRIKRAKDYISDETFLLTYGDGLTDANIREIVDFHELNNGILTMMSAQPDGRFGSVEIGKDDMVTKFLEKPKGDGGWVNAGFFVCNRQVFDYIDGDETIFEQEPLSRIAEDKGLFAYKYSGFWMPMDTLRDKIKLNEMCERNDDKWLR